MHCFHTLTYERLYKGLPTIASSSVPLRVDIWDRLGLLFRYLVDRHHESLLFGSEVGFPRNAFCPPGNCLSCTFCNASPGYSEAAGPIWSTPGHGTGPERTPDSGIASWYFSSGIRCSRLPGYLNLAEALWHDHTLGVAGNAELVVPFAGDGIGICREQPGWEMAFAQSYELASRLARIDTKTMVADANSFGSSRI